MNREVKIGKSLHDTMNDMVQDLPAPKPGAPVELDEADALESLDPLLAGLKKQKAEANAHFERLLKLRGGDDPMTNVSADMLDSARTAYETRLIELQQDRRTMAIARRMVKESRAAIVHAERRTAALQRLRMELFAGRAVQRGREREYNEKLNKILSLIGTLQVVIDEAQKTLCLANAFTRACETRSGAV